MQLLPTAFTERIRIQMGDSEAEKLIEVLDQPSGVSIRLHPEKGKALFPLDSNAMVPWNQEGRYLKERPLFIADPLFHAGAYYVQEASSMFIDFILKHIELMEAPLVLDLCAAPGGKSTLLLSHLQGRGLVVSNEVIRARAQILEENISKWAYANVLITQQDPQRFESLGEVFDLVLVDAPCSGEGMFKKDPKSRTEWSEENVHLCSMRQQRIVAHAMACLRPGGYLIYSTCTFSEVENEHQMSACLDQGFELVPLPEIPQAWGIETSGIGYRFYPHKVQGEGFYVCVLQKTGQAEMAPVFHKYHRNFEPLNKKSLQNIPNWIPMQGSVLFDFKSNLYLVPESIARPLSQIAAQSSFLQPGMPLGNVAHKDFIPAPALAFDHQLTFDNTVELSKEEALQFLRKENFLPQNMQHQGWALLQYEGRGLGWAKLMSNRMNNYYPKEWRILHH